MDDEKPDDDSALPQTQGDRLKVFWPDDAGMPTSKRGYGDITYCDSNGVVDSVAWERMMENATDEQKIAIRRALAETIRGFLEDFRNAWDTKAKIEIDEAVGFFTGSPLITLVYAEVVSFIDVLDHEAHGHVVDWSVHEYIPPKKGSHLTLHDASETEVESAEPTLSAPAPELMNAHRRLMRVRRIMEELEEDGLSHFTEPSLTALNLLMELNRSLKSSPAPKPPSIG